MPYVTSHETHSSSHTAYSRHIGLPVVLGQRGLTRTCSITGNGVVAAEWEKRPCTTETERQKGDSFLDKQQPEQALSAT